MDACAPPAACEHDPAAHDARLLDGPVSFTAAPFPHAAITPALPAATYAALARTFPAPAIFAPQALQANNRVLRLASAEIARDPRIAPEWKAFVAEHTGAAFWSRIVRHFGGELRARYPHLEQQAGKPLEAWKAGCRGEPDCEVALECLLVINTPVREKASAVKGAHIDRADKLWTGLLYMRDAADDSTGGALELYASPPRPRFDKHQAPRRSLRLAQRIGYDANRFVGFVNGIQAIHAVQSRPPTPHVRRYVDFVAELPRGRVFEVPQLGWLHRAAYRYSGQREATR